MAIKSRLNFNNEVFAQHATRSLFCDDVLNTDLASPC